jgi:hypothetical protein
MPTAYALAAPSRSNPVAPTFNAVATSGDTFPPGSDVFLYVKNGAGSTLTVTVAAPNAGPGGLLPVAPTFSIPATSERMFGPFPPQIFSSDGATVAVTYSSATTVTAAAIRCATS